MKDCFKHFSLVVFILFYADCAFANSDNSIYLVLQVGGVALILIIGVLVYLVRREVVQNRIFNLQSIGYKPLYYRNMATGEEHISYSLRDLLGLKDGENVISSIANRLIFDDRQKFSDLYSQLIDISNSHNDIDSCEPNITIKLELEQDVSPLGTQFLNCHHLVLKDHAGFTYGFFLFFSDISTEVNQHNKLNQDNNILQIDLVAKNNLINLLPCPIWVRDKELNVIYFNNEFKKMISYKEGTEASLLKIEEQYKSLAKKAQESRSMQSEDRHVVIDGQRRLYQFFEMPISNTGTMAGIAYDITSKDILKAELDRHIAVQFNLLESTASATAIYGADTRLQFFNQAFIKLWGFDEQWLVTNPTYGQVLERLRENRKLPEQADFQKFKNDQIKLFTDLIHTHNDFFYLPDGRYLRVIVIQHALGGLLFSYEDMTDYFELERSFKTLSAVQKETIDNLNDGITVFSENGKLALSNPKFLKMWNFKESFIETKPHLSKVLSKMQKSISASIDWTSLKDNFMFKISLRVTSNIGIELIDGSIIDVLFVPLSDGGTLISYHDVTDSILVAKSLLDQSKKINEKLFAI